MWKPFNQIESLPPSQFRRPKGLILDAKKLENVIDQSEPLYKTIIADTTNNKLQQNTAEIEAIAAGSTYQLSTTLPVNSEFLPLSAETSLSATADPLHISSRHFSRVRRVPTLRPYASSLKLPPSIPVPSPESLHTKFLTASNSDAIFPQIDIAERIVERVAAGGSEAIIHAKEAMMRGKTGRQGPKNTRNPRSIPELRGSGNFGEGNLSRLVLTSSQNGPIASISTGRTEWTSNSPYTSAFLTDTGNAVHWDADATQRTQPLASDSAATRAGRVADGENTAPVTQQRNKGTGSGNEGLDRDPELGKIDGNGRSGETETISAVALSAQQRMASRNPYSGRVFPTSSTSKTAVQVIDAPLETARKKYDPETSITSGKTFSQRRTGFTVHHPSKPQFLLSHTTLPRTSTAGTNTNSEKNIPDLKNPLVPTVTVTPGSIPHRVITHAAVLKGESAVIRDSSPRFSINSQRDHATQRPHATQRQAPSPRQKDKSALKKHQDPAPSSNPEKVSPKGKTVRISDAVEGSVTLRSKSHLLDDGAHPSATINTTTAAKEDKNSDLASTSVTNENTTGMSMMRVVITAASDHNQDHSIDPTQESAENAAVSIIPDARDNIRETAVLEGSARDSGRDSDVPMHGVIAGDNNDHNDADEMHHSMENDEVDGDMHEEVEDVAVDRQSGDEEAVNGEFIPERASGTSSIGIGDMDNMSHEQTSSLGEIPDHTTTQDTWPLVQFGMPHSEGNSFPDSQSPPKDTLRVVKEGYFSSAHYTLRPNYSSELIQPSIDADADNTHQETQNSSSMEETLTSVDISNKEDVDVQLMTPSKHAFMHARIHYENTDRLPEIISSPDVKNPTFTDNFMKKLAPLPVPAGMEASFSRTLMSQTVLSPSNYSPTSQKPSNLPSNPSNTTYNPSVIANAASAASPAHGGRQQPHFATSPRATIATSPRMQAPSPRAVNGTYNGTYGDVSRRGVNASMQKGGLNASLASSPSYQLLSNLIATTAATELTQITAHTMEHVGEANMGYSNGSGTFDLDISAKTTKKTLENRKSRKTIQNYPESSEFPSHYVLSMGNCPPSRQPTIAPPLAIPTALPRMHSPKLARKSTYRGANMHVKTTSSAVETTVESETVMSQSMMQSTSSDHSATHDDNYNNFPDNTSIAPTHRESSPTNTRAVAGFKTHDQDVKLGLVLSRPAAPPPVLLRHNRLPSRSTELPSHRVVQVMQYGFPRIPAVAQRVAIQRVATQRVAGERGQRGGRAATAGHAGYDGRMGRTDAHTFHSTQAGTSTYASLTSVSDTHTRLHRHQTFAQSRKLLPARTTSPERLAVIRAAMTDAVQGDTAEGDAVQKGGEGEARKASPVFFDVTNEHIVAELVAHGRNARMENGSDVSEATAGKVEVPESEHTGYDISRYSKSSFFGTGKSAFPEKLGVEAPPIGFVYPHPMPRQVWPVTGMPGIHHNERENVVFPNINGVNVSANPQDLAQAREMAFFAASRK